MDLLSGSWNLVFITCPSNDHDIVHIRPHRGNIELDDKLTCASIRLFCAVLEGAYPDLGPAIMNDAEFADQTSIKVSFPTLLCTSELKIFPAATRCCRRSLAVVCCSVSGVTT